MIWFALILVWPFLICFWVVDCVLFNGLGFIYFACFGCVHNLWFEVAFSLGLALQFAGFLWVWDCLCWNFSVLVLAGSGALWGFPVGSAFRFRDCCGYR